MCVCGFFCFWCGVNVVSDLVMHGRSAGGHTLTFIQNYWLTYSLSDKPHPFDLSKCNPIPAHLIIMHNNNSRWTPKRKRRRRRRNKYHCLVPQSSRSRTSFSLSLSSIFPSFLFLPFRFFYFLFVHHGNISCILFIYLCPIHAPNSLPQLEHSVGFCEASQPIWMKRFHLDVCLQRSFVGWLGYIVMVKWGFRERYHTHIYVYISTSQKRREREKEKETHTYKFVSM